MLVHSKIYVPDTDHMVTLVKSCPEAGYEIEDVAAAHLGRALS